MFEEYFLIQNSSWKFVFHALLQKLDTYPKVYVGQIVAYSP
jgi:hypothetical protein